MPQVPALPLSILRKLNNAPEDETFATARTARVSSTVSSPHANQTARYYTPRETVRNTANDDATDDDTSIANAVLALLDSPPERPGDVLDFTPLEEPTCSAEEAAAEDATPAKEAAQEVPSDEAPTTAPPPLTATPPLFYAPPPPAYPSTMDHRRIQWPSLDELPPLDTDEEEEAPVEALVERLAAAG